MAPAPSWLKIERCSTASGGGSMSSRGEGWGREVMLPVGFDTSYTGLEVKRPTGEWSRVGVRSIDGGPLAGREGEASLVMPDGASGPAYLVYDNFRAIMKWNKSTYFATAVGYLADSMAQG